MDKRAAVAEIMEDWKMSNESDEKFITRILALFPEPSVGEIIEEIRKIPRGEILIPDKVMGYTINELHKIIHFAKSRGFEPHPEVEGERKIK
jgi:hypothetical protein